MLMGASCQRFYCRCGNLRGCVYINATKSRKLLGYVQKILDDFNFGQKKCPKIKLYEIFKRPKFLRYSKTTLVSRNKPDVTRKGLKMVGIVKAVTKELEPEDPLKLLVVDCQATLNSKPLWRIRPQTPNLSF